MYMATTAIKLASMASFRINQYTSSHQQSEFFFFDRMQGTQTNTRVNSKPASHGGVSMGQSGHFSNFAVASDIRELLRATDTTTSTSYKKRPADYLSILNGASDVRGSPIPTNASNFTLQARGASNATSGRKHWNNTGMVSAVVLIYHVQCKQIYTPSHGERTLSHPLERGRGAICMPHTSWYSPSIGWMKSNRKWTKM